MKLITRRVNQYPGLILHKGFAKGIFLANLHMCRFLIIHFSSRGSQNGLDCYHSSTWTIIKS
jgi:hypothetical protein